MSGTNTSRRKRDVPHINVEAERAVLGAMLIDPDQVPTLLGMLQASDFYEPRHATIFEAISALHGTGNPVDLVGLDEWLRSRGRLAEVGGSPYVHVLVDACANSLNGPQYARIVRDNAIARAEKTIGAQLTLGTISRAHALHELAALDDRARADLDPTIPAAVSVSAPGVGMLRFAHILADVEPERVRWLWAGRIPLGKLTVLDGDPGLGKSLLCADIAARVSTGAAMPDGTPGVAGGAGVVLLSAEDGLADTIRPRLEAAGADLTRVLHLTAVPYEAPDTGQLHEADVILPRDLPKVEAAVVHMEAALVVIDPIMAYLDGDVNAHRDQDVRGALRQFAALAERTGAAIVVVRHLNKLAGGNPLYRGGGSIGIIGAARSGLLVARHPDDEHLRVVASTKNNLARPLPALTFTVADTSDEVPHVLWGDTSNLTAHDLLAQPQPPDAEARSRTDEASEWLRTYLSRGEQPANDVIAAARSAGIGEKPLRRARERLCVTRREGFGPGSHVLWALAPVAIPQSRPRPPRRPRTHALIPIIVAP